MAKKSKVTPLDESQYLNENDIDIEDDVDEPQPQEESEESDQEVEQPIKETKPTKQKRQYNIKDPKVIEKKRELIKKAQAAKAQKTHQRKAQKLVEELTYIGDGKKLAKKEKDISQAAIEEAVKRIEQGLEQKLKAKAAVPKETSKQPKPKPIKEAPKPTVHPDAELLRQCGIII